MSELWAIKSPDSFYFFNSYCEDEDSAWEYTCETAYIAEVDDDEGATPERLLELGYKAVRVRVEEIEEEKE